MAKEKRIKNREVKIRVHEDMYIALSEYVKDNNTTRTKVVERFLKDLLSDRLGK